MVSVAAIPQAHIFFSIADVLIDGVDGCILFSDILTPLPAMGIDFSIAEGGDISIDPIRTFEACQQRLRHVTMEDYQRCTPFVGSVLKSLREHVPKDTTVLGFVGLPFTIGSYLIEGKTGVATSFENTKALMRTQAPLVHEILTCLASNIGEYACYQIESGAQVIQVFDSWAGHVDDPDYEQFVLPYQQHVIARIKDVSPDTPVIIYMAPRTIFKRWTTAFETCRVRCRCISIDHTVDMAEACRVLPKHLGVQGNLDPQLLRDGPLAKIKETVFDILHCTKDRSHIMNLGHGIHADTQELNAAYFVKVVQEYKRKE
jgi:uroporphyrinogen decarboxylase